MSYWNIIKGIMTNQKNDYKLNDIKHVMKRTLDINKILQANNDIEKLKHVLLTKEQEMLLNFSTKPTFLSVKNQTSIGSLKYLEKLTKKKH